MSIDGENDLDEVQTHFAEADGKFVVKRSHDVEPLLDHLARLRNETTGKSPSGDIYYVGELDPVVLEDYLNKAGVTFHEFLVDPTHIQRIMTDPDYSKFRVWTGRF